MAFYQIALNMYNHPEIQKKFQEFLINIDIKNSAYNMT